MPTERRLPLCPAAVVTAKPRRERWGLEEAWDLAAILGGTVEETRYPGVYIVWAPTGPGWDPGLAPRMAFLARIVVPRRCLRPPTREGLVDALEGAPREARIIMALRGSSKQPWVREVVEARVRSDRRSPVILVLDGVDDLLVVSWGRRRSCGYGCLLVAPSPEP